MANAVRYHVAGPRGGMWDVIRTDHNGVETRLNTSYASKYAAGERADSLNRGVQRRQRENAQVRGSDGPEA